jgi:tripartite-type tricarboxylate transporter receptor subunit TctC
MFDITGTGRNFIANGQARGLAVTSTKRNTSMPDVPTMIEAGIADYEVVGWFGVTGPKAIPAAIADKLTAAINAVKRNPEFLKAIDEGGYTVDMSDNKEFEARIDRELKMWSEVVTKGKIEAQ